MRKTVPFLLVLLIALLVPSGAVQSQEPPQGYSELHLVWQVDSIEQRQNPMEPRPITEDCLFDEARIEIGDIYEATIGYQEPLILETAEKHWPFGPEYPLSLELGDLSLSAEPYRYGDTYPVTHVVGATKYALTEPPSITADHLEVSVFVTTGFPASLRWPPRFAFQWGDASGTVLELGQPISFDDPGWETSSVQVLWFPTDGSVCVVDGTLAIDPVILVEGLRSHIADLGLPTGLATSLTTKTDTAIRVLSDTNPKNDDAAVNLLQALINEVAAQTGKKISEDGATDLVVAAERILTLLGGEPEPEYEMIELGTLGTSPFGYSFAQGINDHGQVVGYSRSDTGWHMFLWEEGEIVDLGIPEPGEPDFIWPRAINDKGQIVGTFRTSEVAQSAFMFDNGEWIMIKQEGVYWSDARDINSRGEVLGWDFGQSTGLRTFIWSEEGFDYLETPGVSMRPQRMNDRGEIIALDFSGPVVGSIRWDGGEITEIVSATGGAVEALGINDRGLVVGRLSESLGVDGRAFSWNDGELIELPGLGGDWANAMAVNNKGLVVGSAEAVDGRSHAVLWNDGQLTDLGTHPGQHHTSTGCTATDINARGQVVGYCWTDYGPRAYLWDPHPRRGQ